jgi:hypothetical protein
MTRPIRTLLIALSLLALATADTFADPAPAAKPAATTARTPSPKGAHVYIVTPQDGATVHSPVHIVFGLSGMGVAPAGVDHWHRAPPSTGRHDAAADERAHPQG